MASIAQHQRDIQRYQVLKGQLRNVISELNSAAGRAGSLDLEVKSSYQVNSDDAAISGRVTDLKHQLDNTVDFLDGTVLPSIDSAVEHARSEIARLEEEERRRREEEERRRREEEERRRREEEENS